MFGLFKRKSEKEKLQEKYAKLMEEAFLLSKTDRTASDAKTAEANALLAEIEKLP
jgi:superfamily I DNA and RNA helicase